MPSKSKKQHNLMAAVANNPKFAKKVGIPQSVGEDFTKADKGRKFNRGGEMAESKKMVGKELAFMKKKGAPKSMIKHEKAEAGMEAGGVTKKLPTAKQMGDMGMKKGGDVKKMFGGGMSGGRGFAGLTRKLAPRSAVASAASQLPGKMAELKGSNANAGFAGGPRRAGMKSGGLAAGHKAADGVAKKGKTRAMQVKMAAGGMAKKGCK